MKFLVDAHLPRRLCRILESYGHTAIHTLDLPQENETEDRDIMLYADTNDCIVNHERCRFCGRILPTTRAAQAVAYFNRQH
jgi:predicted nuclease of predicted toxin-antitoxin system